MLFPLLYICSHIDYTLSCSLFFYNLLDNFEKQDFIYFLLFVYFEGMILNFFVEKSEVLEVKTGDYSFHECCLIAWLLPVSLVAYKNWVGVFFYCSFLFVSFKIFPLFFFSWKWDREFTMFLSEDMHQVTPQCCIWKGIKQNKSGWVTVRI